MEQLDQAILIVVNVNVMSIRCGGQVPVLVVSVGAADDIGELIFIVDDEGGERAIIGAIVEIPGGVVSVTRESQT
jgi:hypothetical protein